MSFLDTYMQQKLDPNAQLQSQLAKAMLGQLRQDTVNSKSAPVESLIKTIKVLSDEGHASADIEILRSVAREIADFKP